MSNKFWLEDIRILFSGIQIVPLYNISLNEQLNAITRLIIIIFLILLLFNFGYSIYFLVISLGIIIIIYYIQRKKMSSYQTENYAGPTAMEINPMHRSEQQGCYRSSGPTYTHANLNKLAPSKTVKLPSGAYVQQSIIQTPQRLPFCNDAVSIDPPSQMAVSINQRLAGPPNPKTLIKPVSVPPIEELEYWRDNELIVRSMINSQGIQQDMYLSGYAESSCCGYIGNGAEREPVQSQDKMVAIPLEVEIGGNIGDENDGTMENYIPVGNRHYPPPKGRGILAPTPAEDIPYIPSLATPSKEDYIPVGNRHYPPPKGRGILAPTPAEDIPYVPSLDGPSIENYADFTTVTNPKKVTIQPNEPGWVNTACGYNPEQVYRSGLPSNLPAGNCEQNPRLKQYNENLFTQIVTPGVYTRTQVNEPINSNIGISFQQQFEPVTCHRDDKGLHYLEHDPRIIEPAIDTPGLEEEKARYDNVYDPRFYGYGTSYRSYLEPVTGQTRFMYDDINAIRMPNYVVRSKIDTMPFADSYGPMQKGSEMGNVHNPHIRYLVQDEWMRNSLEFRNDMTERLMRKKNAEAWQRRQAPLGPYRK